MSGIAITVTGPVRVEDLGLVDCHEHLAAPAARRTLAGERDLNLDNPALIAADLQAFAAEGGRTVVEMTTVDYGRDLAALAWLSQTTGVQIIAATGFNKGRYAQALVDGCDVAALSARQVADVRDGADGVRCGVVKFGTSLHEIQPCEVVAARAAARTHFETGVPISTHTEAGTMSLEQLDLLAAEGVTASAVIVGHLDRNPDLGLHREIIGRGAFVAYDQLPKPKYATADAAVANIVALAAHGLHEQVLLGGDLSRRSYFRGWGGQLGLDVVPGAFRQRLRAALLEAALDADAVLADLYVNNPARAFCVRQVAMTTTEQQGER